MYLRREIGYLRVPQVLKLLCVGQATLYRWVSSGEFPQPVKLGKKTVVWPIKEVTEWIEAKNVREKQKS